MEKQLLLETLRAKRKKYGKDSKEVKKAIYNIVRRFPLYDGYEEDWLRKNGHSLK